MKKKRNYAGKTVIIILAAAMIFTALPLLNVPAFTSEAKAITASGKINDSEVNLRKSATTGS